MSNNRSATTIGCLIERTRDDIIAGTPAPPRSSVLAPLPAPGGAAGDSLSPDSITEEEAVSSIADFLLLLEEPEDLVSACQFFVSSIMVARSATLVPTGTVGPEDRGLGVTTQWWFFYLATSGKAESGRWSRRRSPPLCSCSRLLLLRPCLYCQHISLPVTSSLVP